MSGVLGKLKAVGIATALGLAACGAALLIFSVIVSKINMPHSVIGIFSAAALISGSIVSGFFLGFSTGHGGIKCGAIGGGAVFGVLFLLSAVFNGGIGLFALIKLLICLISGIIGGIVGVNRN